MARREIEAHHRQQKIDAENRAAQQASEALDAREARLKIWAGAFVRIDTTPDLAEFLVAVYLCLRAAAEHMREAADRNSNISRSELLIDVAFDHEASAISVTNHAGDSVSIRSGVCCVEIEYGFQRCGARSFERIFWRDGRPVGCPEGEAHPEELFAKKTITRLVRGVA